MKTLKLLFGFALSAVLFTSCHREVIVDYYEEVPPPAISVDALLSSYELWYVDINSTIGYGTTPFLQKAFTISFRNGLLYANNNLVGIGSQGNGFGILVGEYDAYNMILDVYHDVDGFETFDVYQIDSNTIELYNPNNDTSYFLDGYQRSNFDYDFVFYDNIHYFLQEYVAWEKTYTSQYGALNDFDYENYLQFVPGGDDVTFRSSQDIVPTGINNLVWDFTGDYFVSDIPGNMYLKNLVLDYDFFTDEYFELSVINDYRIELFHPDSETLYEFEGRGYIEYRQAESAAGGKGTGNTGKLRKQKTEKKDNPRSNNRE